MRRPLLFAFGAIAFAYLWSLYGPWLPDDPRSDTCEIGSAPNSKYQEFLAVAQKKIADGSWPPIRIWAWEAGPDRRKQYAEVESAFERRLNELASQGDSPNEKLLAIHAVMRAHGARYDPRVQDPQFADRDKRRLKSNVFVYRLDARKLGNYFPFGRWRALNFYVRADPFTIESVNFGGVRGWGGPSIDWKTISLTFSPWFNVCPKSFSEAKTTLQNATLANLRTDNFRLV